MYSYKELEELAGYTARVSLLLETMKDIRDWKFNKALINNAGKGDSIERKPLGPPWNSFFLKVTSFERSGSGH